MLRQPITGRVSESNRTAERGSEFPWQSPWPADGPSDGSLNGEMMVTIIGGGSIPSIPHLGIFGTNPFCVHVKHCETRVGPRSSLIRPGVERSDLQPEAVTMSDCKSPKAKVGKVDLQTLS